MQANNNVPHAKNIRYATTKNTTIGYMYKQTRERLTCVQEGCKGFDEKRSHFLIGKVKRSDPSTVPTCGNSKLLPRSCLKKLKNML